MYASIKSMPGTDYFETSNVNTNYLFLVPDVVKLSFNQGKSVRITGLTKRVRVV